MNQSPEDDGKVRPYICPCNKSYLSYPALFTHIKQKHNGIPPGEIIRPKTNNKRGRPRKNFDGGTSEVSSPGEHSPAVKVENKNPLDRFYRNKSEDAQLQSIIKQARKIRNSINANVEFNPPLSFGNHPEYEMEVKPSHQHQENPLIEALQSLSQKLSESFSALHINNFRPLNEVDILLELNVLFNAAKNQERNPTKKLVGVDQWQMELKDGLFEFLDWSQSFLSFDEFKNMELLMGIVYLFYYEMLPIETEKTTCSYVLYLNLFTTKMMEQIKNDPLYNNIFSLDKTHSMTLLELMHEWFTLNDLSYHEIKINPFFKGEKVYERVNHELLQ